MSCMLLLYFSNVFACNLAEKEFKICNTAQNFLNSKFVTKNMQPYKNHKIIFIFNQVKNENQALNFGNKADRKHLFYIQANSLSSRKYTLQTNARSASAVVVNFVSVSQASAPNPRCILMELTFPASTINRVYATAYCMAASLWRTLR